ncbi:hypothetical protein LY78DRAFT_654336 [Colletotrichum sublineola]|nr:hypothetical protein LY78DRAFT_654336 [Colletotrichum sublineola]
MPYAVSVTCQCKGQAGSLVVDTHLNLLDGAITASFQMTSGAVFIKSIVVGSVAAVVLHG